MSNIVVNNPLRKALNLEKARNRINASIKKYTANLASERQYIINNPGGLPNRVGAAQRRMLQCNAEITRLKRERNNLHGGRKRKTRRKSV